MNKISVRFIPKAGRKHAIAGHIAKMFPEIPFEEALEMASHEWAEIPADKAKEFVSTIEPLCSKVFCPTSEREAAETRFFHAASQIEDKVITRVFNLLADVIETFDTKPRR